MGRSARARVADSVSRWLDWAEANRTIYLGTIAPGEDIAEPEVRRVVTKLMRRAVALVAAYHADIAVDSPRLRHALECWTGLNRAATRRWLHGEATREATHELLASTLEHVLRTFGTPPRQASADLHPDRSRSTSWIIEGSTYAQLDREDPLRETAMTASFLCASLFTSVVAFGVAAMAAGVGVMLVLLGAGAQFPGSPDHQHCLRVRARTYLPDWRWSPSS